MRSRMSHASLYTSGLYEGFCLASRASPLERPLVSVREHKRALRSDASECSWGSQEDFTPRAATFETMSAQYMAYEKTFKSRPPCQSPRRRWPSQARRWIAISHLRGKDPMLERARGFKSPPLRQLCLGICG